MFYFFISLIFVNLFLYYNNYLFLVFLFISLVFLALRVCLKTYLVTVVLVLVFFSFHFNYYNYVSDDNFIKEEVKVIEVKEKYSVVEFGGINYLLYQGDCDLKEGNKVYVEGSLVRIKGTYNNFYTYLNKKGINYEIDYEVLVINDGRVSVRQSMMDFLLKDKKENSKSYLKLILFNISDEYNQDFYNTFSLYSLTYLIAVSGFHISLLLAFFKKIFHNHFVGYAIISFYLYLLNFSVSSYRAFLYKLFKIINYKLDFELSKNDILSLIGSVFIVINPGVMFSYSFIFSFLTTFVLEIFNLYTKRKIILSFYIYLVNIPLILLFYYKLNLSTLFFSIVLSVPISFLYVFSFIFLFLNKFYLLYELVIECFWKLFSFLDNFNFILVFGKPSVVFVIVYYLFLLFFLILKERKSKKRYVWMVLIFLLLNYQYFKPILVGREMVYFLNVGQGDCVVFLVPNSKSVVLVDTGGSKYRDVAKREIIPFLESKGIDKINKIIISHDDYDHNGALDSLKENMVVEEVINSSLVERVNIGLKVFMNLNVSDRRDNDGSIVLYGEYAGYYLLLMGDVTSEVEKRIDVSKVDVLKIGHHGSKDSSSEEFLKRMKGKFAVISVGENNIYGHPHESVIERLKSSGYVILRTDKHNDIGFGKIFKFRFIDYFK